MTSTTKLLEGIVERIQTAYDRPRSAYTVLEEIERTITAALEEQAPSTSEEALERIARLILDAYLEPRAQRKDILDNPTIITALYPSTKRLELPGRYAAVLHHWENSPGWRAWLWRRLSVLFGSSGWLHKGQTPVSMPAYSKIVIALDDALLFEVNRKWYRLPVGFARAFDRDYLGLGVVVERDMGELV